MTKYTSGGEIRIDQIAIAAAENGPDTILALANGHLFMYRGGAGGLPIGWYEMTLNVIKEVQE